VIHAGNGAAPLHDDRTPEYGRLLLEKAAGPPGRLVVLDASPRVLIADELLSALFWGDMNSGGYWIDPGITLERPARLTGCNGAVGCCNAQAGLCFRGGLFKIDAADRNIVYEIGDYEQQLNAWWAQWPD
jgi:hypothetical protein